jgi:hypothetical protein
VKIVAGIVAHHVRKDLPKRFTLRNTWVSKGIRITPATSLAAGHCQLARAVLGAAGEGRH